MGYSQTYALGPFYYASDDLLASSDVEVGLPAYATLLHEVAITQDLANNTSFRMKVDLMATNGNSYCNFRLNGVALEGYFTTAGAYVTHSLDYTFVSGLHGGDKLQVWGFNTLTGNLKNFRVYGKPTVFYPDL